MARSTRGCALTGPGPISNRCGGSISPNKSGLKMLAQSIDEPKHRLERQFGILRVDMLGGVVADSAFAAEEQHRRRAKRRHHHRVVPCTARQAETRLADRGDRI